MTPRRSRVVDAPGVGTLVVDEVDGARVERLPGVSDAEVEGLLDGSGRALHLQLQRVLPLHIAAVAKGGRAVGFVGPPGVGKSSLAAALTARGWRWVSDDIAAVRWAADGSPLLEPNPGRVRIWGDSARQLGWSTGAEHRIAPDGDRFIYDLAARFVSADVPLAAVYLVTPVAGSRREFVPVHGHERFAAFHHGAIYNDAFIDTPEARRWQFDQTLRLAQRVPLTMLHRPAGAALRQVARSVEQHSARL